MKNILFLNSYSQQAPDHYRYAMRMAMRLKAKLDVAHVYDHHDHMESETKAELATSKALSEWLLKLQEEKKLALDGFVNKYTGKQFASLIGDTHALQGKTRKEVTNFLDASNYDLVIMGMQAHSMLSDLIGAGLTQYLIDTAKCPLLLLPRNSKQLLIKHICFATDLADESLPAINYIFDVSLLLKASFHLLTVLKANADIGRANDRIEDLQDSIRNGDILELYYTIEIGDPEEKIKAYPKNNDVDLLVLTTRQRKRWIEQFNQTITKAVVRDAEIPLLILKEEYIDGYQIL